MQIALQLPPVIWLWLKGHYATGWPDSSRRQYGVRANITAHVDEYLSFAGLNPSHWLIALQVEHIFNGRFILGAEPCLERRTPQNTTSQ
jgi:hypothetical protein